MLNTFKKIAACSSVFLSPIVFAHDGHGLMGSHWHPTDAYGFVAFGLIFAIAIWLGRGGK